MEAYCVEINLELTGDITFEAFGDALWVLK